jgi:hypothetical protein
MLEPPVWRVNSSINDGSNISAGATTSCGVWGPEAIGESTTNINPFPCLRPWVEESVFIVAASYSLSRALNCRKGKEVGVVKDCLAEAIIYRIPVRCTPTLGREAVALPGIQTPTPLAIKDANIADIGLDGHIPVRVLKRVPRVGRSVGERPHFHKG